jgi:hypothetical protein
VKNLFGEAVVTRKVRAKKRKTGRSQYRRSAWEDYSSAILFAGRLWESDSLPPWSPSPSTSLTPSDTFSARVEELRARWEGRTKLLRPADPANPAPDWVRILTEIGHAMHEEYLAKRGLRYTFAGIHRVHPDDPASGWRVQVWDTNEQKHEHVCYKPTEGEARAALIAYWRDSHGLDVSYTPPDWFREMLAEAQRLQAATSEAAGGMAWDVKGDEEEEPEQLCTVDELLAEWRGSKWYAMHQPARRASDERHD